MKPRRPGGVRVKPLDPDTIIQALPKLGCFIVIEVMRRDVVIKLLSGSLHIQRRAEI